MGASAGADAHTRTHIHVFIFQTTIRVRTVDGSLQLMLYDSFFSFSFKALTFIQASNKLCTSMIRLL